MEAVTQERLLAVLVEKLREGNRLDERFGDISDALSCQEQLPPDRVLAALWLLRRAQTPLPEDVLWVMDQNFGSVVC